MYVHNVRTFLGMTYGDNSARFLLRLPPELLAALRKLAKIAKDGKPMPMSRYVREILQREVDRAEKRKGTK